MRYPLALTGNDASTYIHSGMTAQYTSGILPLPVAVLANALVAEQRLDVLLPQLLHRVLRITSSSKACTAKLRGARLLLAARWPLCGLVPACMDGWLDLRGACMRKVACTHPWVCVKACQKGFRVMVCLHGRQGRLPIAHRPGQLRLKLSGTMGACKRE